MIQLACREREDTITDKEKRIFDLKKKNQVGYGSLSCMTARQTDNDSNTILAFKYNK